MSNQSAHVLRRRGICRTVINLAAAMLMGWMVDASKAETLIVYMLLELQLDIHYS